MRIHVLLLCVYQYPFKVILFSALLTPQRFICKTGRYRKWSITFYSFGLKQFGKLHVVGHKLLRFDKKQSDKFAYSQNLRLQRDLEF